MSAQINYNAYQDVRGLHGSLYDLNPAELTSGCAEGAVPFGVAVSRGTNEQQILAGGADTDIIGISVRDLGKSSLTIGVTATQIEDTQMGTVLRSGYINVLLSTGSATAGAQARVNVTTGEIIGDSESVAGDVVLLTDGYFEKGAGNGEVAVLRFKK